MEERVRMLSDYETGNWSVSNLCRRYGVCRDTFYEWRKRRESDGPNWFVDRSHAPLHCPHETAGALADVIVSLRKRFPHLGPRKLLAILERQAPETCWPAASTIGGILKQAGLITPIKRRRRAIDQKRPVTAVAAANDEWATDFKGWFRTTDRSRIDPLTITDGHSRFLIDVRIVQQTIEGSRRSLKRHFSLMACRFRSAAIMGRRSGRAAQAVLRACRRGGSSSASSRTSSIRPRRKRMADMSACIARSRHRRRAQPRRTRPNSKPASTPSAGTTTRSARTKRWANDPRTNFTCHRGPMPDRIEDPWYDADHQVRRVRPSGEIMWKGDRLFVTEVLAGELLGIAEPETGDHVCASTTATWGSSIAVAASPGSLRPVRGSANRPAANSKLSGIIPVQSVDNQPG